MSPALRHKRLYDDSVAMEIYTTSLRNINISFIHNVQEEVWLKNMHKKSSWKQLSLEWWHSNCERLDKIRWYNVAYFEEVRLIYDQQVLSP